MLLLSLLPLLLLLLLLGVNGVPRSFKSLQKQVVFGTLTSSKPALATPTTFSGTIGNRFDREVSDETGSSGTVPQFCFSIEIQGDERLVNSGCYSPSPTVASELQ